MGARPDGDMMVLRCSVQIFFFFFVRRSDLITATLNGMFGKCPLRVESRFLFYSCMQIQMEYLYA